MIEGKLGIVHCRNIASFVCLKRELRYGLSHRKRNHILPYSSSAVLPSRTLSVLDNYLIPFALSMCML